MAYLVKEQYKIPDYIIPLFDTLAHSGFTNQPAGDAVEILSNNAGDTGLVTVFGTNHTTGILKHETVKLAGTTVVSTSESNWGNIYGVFLGDIYGKNITPAIGTITIREASGDLSITTISATKISKGMVGFSMTGKNIVIVHVSGNLYFNHGVAVTTVNGYPFSTGEKLAVTPSELFYLISDASGATSKILIYKDN